GWNYDGENVRVFPSCYKVYDNTQSEDKYKKAFNVAKMIFDKKLKDMKKIEDFIKLVEEIADRL
ncbi:MAG: hypothetical protein WH035_02920, partial [Spirochaetota bacterium]